MAKARNLCNFEKDVLLSLIGATLLPDKFIPEDIILYLDENQSKNEVKTILSELCSSLEERLHNLKYFYKSATLVREGMVIVRSSTLSGDVSSASVSCREIHSPVIDNYVIF